MQNNIFTTDRLSLVAGASLLVAGTLYAGVQINHPTLTLDFVGTTEYVVRQAAKTVMSVLALIGITALYAGHARRVGVLGLVGYVLFGLGYLAMTVVEAVAGFVLPAIAQTSPGYVQDVFTAAVGAAPAGDIGGIQVLLTLSGVGYMLGGLLFGIALHRARVGYRWASAALAAGTIGTLALAFLPESFNRPFAVPVGIALAGLGWWSLRSRPAAPLPHADEAFAVTPEPVR